MEIFEGIRTMLAIRRYQDRAVPQDVIRRILEAGRLTGSARNRQPWHFVVVENRDSLKRISEIAETGRYVDKAPLAIVVAANRTPIAVADASRAIQSMMLAAWEEGVGSNWVGFGGHEEVKELLGMPENVDIVGIIPFGYPADKVGAGKKQRKPLGEIAHRERWGQPFE